MNPSNNLNPGDHSVPAVQGAWGAVPSSAWATQSPGSQRYQPMPQQNPFPQPSQQQYLPQQPFNGSAPQTLNFTESTAQPYVQGSMAPRQAPQQEERMGLVPPNSHSDAPPGAVPGVATEQQRLQEESAKFAFYNARRYRPYFNVDTKDVLWRVGNSMIGLFRANFIEVTMKSPDLYGPFWIATTLVLLTAISGNFAGYIHWRSEANRALPFVPRSNATAAPSGHNAVQDQWFTDYTKLSASAGIFYGYVFIIGLLLFFLVKWFKGDLRIVNVWCVYGYALTIYIPVSMVCVIPIDWLRWVLVGVATLLSGGFLLRNFKAAIFAAAPARAVIILLVIFALHAGLGLGLKLYFFSY